MVARRINFLRCQLPVKLLHLQKYKTDLIHMNAERGKNFLPPADRKTIHMVGHGHVDPAWLWPVQEGMHAALSTFRSADARMNEDPNYQFIGNQILFYDYTKKVAPDTFEKIQQRVNEGRWHPIGFQWVEPDCNIPSGESVLRQYLLGGRFIHENFGDPEKKIALQADPFGHSETTAKLAKHAGMDGIIIMRPEGHEKGLQSESWKWESDDGSTIPAQRIRDYNTYPNEMEEHVKGVLIDQDGDKKNILMFFGVGNHGGGPTKENIRLIKELQQDSEHEVIFSNPINYFDALENEIEKGLFIPTHHGEMQPHATGCYSVGAELKQKNRRAENMLLAAEKFRSFTLAKNLLPYPTELQEQQKTIAENQFHDTAGATLPREYLDDAIKRYDETISITTRAAETALGAIAANVKIEHEEGMTPLIVANPNTWKSRTPVEVEVQNLKAGAKLVDNDDNEISFQEIDSITRTGGRHRISFIPELPSLGYKVFRLQNEAENFKQPERMNALDTAMANDKYILTIDKKSGNISGLFDKEKNINLFEGLAGVPVVIDDKSDTWGHGIYRYDKQIGQFAATESPKLVEHGNVQSTIRVKSEYEKSTMTQDFTMYKDLNMIRVDVSLDWQEHHKMLKLRFPMGIDQKRRHTFETPYGSKSREENGLEVPQQSWVDISGTHGPTHEHVGVSFINDGKYAGDVHGNEYSMTILRSPVYAHHEPQELDPEKDHDYMDQGKHRFSYWIAPHDQTWKQANTPHLAAECNQPPLILSASGNEYGTLPQEDSFAEAGAKNVMMTVIKQAEDPTIDAYVVRLHETNKKTTNTTIRIGEREIPIAMKPAAIKSLIVPFDPKAPIFETDAMEISRIAFE
jgi:alpha-mannosidase